MSALGSVESKEPDAFVHHQRQGHAALCEARLAALLPPVPSSDGPAAALSPEGVYTQARRKLYQGMEDALAARGLLVGGTQGLELGDLFTVHGRALRAVLHELDVPVRAVVVPVRDAGVAARLSGAVARHLAPIMPDAGMWVQNHGLYHSTIFHASTHLTPVVATPAEVAREAALIEGVAARACPLRVVLERVVATPSGTVLACWQLAAGTDPALLRRALRAALPNAPEKQMVTDEPILHTTLARVITHPLPSEGEDDAEQGGEGAAAAAAAAAAVLQRAVEGMTQELCGTEATLDTLWFVEEQDRLALALEGRFSKRPIVLRCEDGPPQQQQQQQGRQEQQAPDKQQPAPGRKLAPQPGQRVGVQPGEQAGAGAAEDARRGLLLAAQLLDKSARALGQNGAGQQDAGAGAGAAGRDSGDAQPQAKEQLAGGPAV